MPALPVPMFLQLLLDDIMSILDRGYQKNILAVVNYSALEVTVRFSFLTHALQQDPFERIHNVILGCGLAWGLSWFFNFFTGGKYTFSDINLYFVFFSGALFHIAIDAIKSTKSSTGIQFKSVDDWSRWINIKELSIIFGIFLLDLTFIGLVVTVGINELDKLTLVAAGYSFDSIGEIFSNRFENILGKKATSIKDKISIT